MWNPDARDPVPAERYLGESRGEWIIPAVCLIIVLLAITGLAHV